MRRAALVLAAAACGDNLAPTGSFELVGHADLGARGMNAALAVAGDTVYVGSRIDQQPVEIVDVSDPTQPAVVGEIGPPDEGLVGISSRELRAVADLNLLVILNLRCAVDLHGCSPGQAESENLKLYDITNRRAPRLVGTYYAGSRFRDPHELFLWRDPVDKTRILVFLTVPGAAPQLEIVDVTTPSAPTQVISWDAIRDGGLPSGGGDDILHSVSAGDDGRVAYFSHQTGGLVLVDLRDVIDKADAPQLRMITPPAQALRWPGMGPHSAVQVPNRSLLVVTEEIYPAPFGTGCPWGHLRVVDTTVPASPSVAGEYALPEQGSCAMVPAATAFTAHNATATFDLALVTWYAGGLQAIDISDPTTTVRLAEFRPQPLPSVVKEDPALGGNPVEMWSYPVIQDGLVYVVDVRNGLYVLRYHGRWSEEVAERRFLEGNSNLGAYLPLR